MENATANTWIYYLSEGAVLRTTEPSSLGDLQIYYPGVGWERYYEYKDIFFSAHRITPEKAQELISKD